MSVTRNEIIQASLRKIGVYDQGETVPAEDINEASFALDLMIKEWQIEPSMRLWERVEGFLFTRVGQKQYFLGENVTASGFSEFTESKRWTPFCSKFYSAKVDGDSGNATKLKDIIRRPDNQKDLNKVMENLDQEFCWLGVFMEPDMDANYPVQKTTLVWLPGTLAYFSEEVTINLFSGFTEGNVPEGFDNVFLVMEKDVLPKPQKLLELSRVRYANHTGDKPIDTPLELAALGEYNMLSLKYSSGPPNIAQYNPEIDRGRLQLWPNDDSSVHVIRIYYENPLSGFDNLASKAEFPEEWHNALVWSLAAELAPEYGLPPNQVQFAMQMAELKKQRLREYDQEQGSLYFEMSYEGRK